MSTQVGSVSGSSPEPSNPPADGARIVLTAPLTETIDHAGYFIQMRMASLPIWLEGILNRKYPNWKNLERNPDGTGLTTCRPACVCSRRRCSGGFRPRTLSCCYPADLHRFIGPNTRVVAVSTHNPLGVTFAAGVYTSIFGSASQPINSHYATRDVPDHQGQPVPLRASRSSSAARAAGRSSRPTRGKT